MIELLRKGTKVKVHPLEWFEKSYKYVESYTGSGDYYLSPKNDKASLRSLISSDKLQFCGKYVTIDKVIISSTSNGHHYIMFEIEEYKGRSSSVDFFDLSTITSTLKINEYCNNFCIYNSICDTVNCSLKFTKISNNVKIEYDYINYIVKYKVRVKPLEWFEKNCSKSIISGFLNYRTLSSIYSISPSMQNLFGKVVTVRDIIILNKDEYIMRIEEDGGIWDWRLDFFNIPVDYDDSNYLDNYCNNNCILGDRSKCDNFECPFYY